MKGQSIILSAAGFKNIIVKEEEEEFVFIIGTSEMKMNRIFAEFISPKVSHIHHSDPTINYHNLTRDVMSKNKNKNPSNQKMKFLENIIERVSNQNTISKMIELSRGERIETFSFLMFQ